jgi:hypothetical protein
MKTLIAILTLAAALATGYSQTESPTQTFFQSAASYFTSFNTNLTTFSPSENTFDIMSGVENQQGVGITAVLGLRYNPIRTDSGIMAGVSAVIRNADVAGTIVSEEIGLSLSKVKHDVKLSFIVSPGYHKEFDSGYVGLSAEVNKALTQNTFAGLRLTHDLFFKDKNQTDTPKLWIQAGITF